MFKAMSKRELSIFWILIGLILGMLISVFLGYKIKTTDLTTMLENSCQHSTPETISISFFGQNYKINCSDGEVHHYNLFKLPKKQD